MTKIIAANWKMNNVFDEADEWLDGFFKGYSANYDQFKKVEMLICPPAILLDYIDSELMEDGFQFLEEVLKKEGRTLEGVSAEEINKIVVEGRPLKICAQDCHFEESGSFTGDISAAMLKKVGCEYVIIGHSERRANHHESNEIIAKKIAAAVKQNLTPILCVGESKEIRDLGKHLHFVYQQIMQSLADIKTEKLVIAYEPIWSIGTGLTPTSEQIAEMSKLIKKIFAEKFSDKITQPFILYGGSVTSQNSGEILKIAGIDGLLVGKASLDANEFLKICSSAF